MNLGLILDMAATGFPGRTALTAGDERISYADLAQRAWAAARLFKDAGATAVLYLDTNRIAYPVCLFGAAAAGVPFVPLNYRLAAPQLRELIATHPGAVLVGSAGAAPTAGLAATTESEVFLASLPGSPAAFEPATDPDLVCVMLYTSGTTAAPKAALLRHRHLMAYIFGTVEFGSADADDAALVAVPPYHVAGLANVLSNAYAGRRIVYVDGVDPARWVATVRGEGITQAMVVPTMLARIVRYLGDDNPRTPTLRLISYGGSRLPLPVLERALTLFDQTEFVNAYGLTETSATIALLSGEDHRQALGHASPAARRRLASVGRPVPGIEIEVRDASGHPVASDEAGLIFVRGEQISGEYSGASALDPDGWFPTRDRGWVDEDGYLFIDGRADDTIIRGGENIAPAEIEDVLLANPDVVDAVVVGVPDEEWGQQIAAAVVLTDGSRVTPEQLKQSVRARLRSSRTPGAILVLPELPRNATGKVMRRDVLKHLTPGSRGAESAGHS